jgi:hypothetical protein
MARPAKTAALVAIVLAVTGLTAFNLFDVARDAPKFSELVAHDEVLQSPVEIAKPSGRRPIRGLYAVFSMDGERATVEDVCYVWNCRLPQPIKALHRGDHLLVWSAGHRIWQLNHDGELLLDYDQAVAAHQRAATRKERVVGLLIAAMIGALSWVVVRRRRTLSASVRRNVPARVSFRVAGKGGLHLGTNVHERVLSGPALDRFRDAAKRRDREAMIAALVEAGLSEASAGYAADALLADPESLSA